MEQRKQFTFYRSYYEAVKRLPKGAQTAVLLAICDYALNGTEPQLRGAAESAFILIRPTLDAGRKKAEAGKRGGQAPGREMPPPPPLPYNAFMDDPDYQRAMRELGGGRQ